MKALTLVRGLAMRVMRQPRRHGLAPAGSIAAVAMLSVVLALPPLTGSGAQEVPQRAGGASARAASGTFSGRIAGDDVADYPVTASAGDLLQVTLRTTSGAVFDIIAPGTGAPPLEGASAVRQWHGTLPAAGTYTVRVRLPAGSASGPAAGFIVSYALSGTVSGRSD